MYKVKYSALTTLDAAEVTETDLFPGSQVLMCVKGKSYAVTVLADKESGEGKENKGTESESVYMYI